MQETELMPPVHPGEILAEEYLAPLGVTPYHTWNHRPSADLER